MKRALKVVINRNSPDKWKEDTKKSIELYNNWFLNFAPATYIRERHKAMLYVDEVIKITNNLHLNVKQLRDNPEIIKTLRMTTTPPIAKARLAGFSGMQLTLLDRLESGNLPTKLSDAELKDNLKNVINVIEHLLDKDIFPWLANDTKPTENELNVAECVVADRLCGTLSDPIIRNEQENRQIELIRNYLQKQGYMEMKAKDISSLEEMPVGRFCFHLNVPVHMITRDVNISVDVAIKRKDFPVYSLPLLIECKSAGDFTNTNKRRKEEAQKIEQLKSAYGNDIDYVLFLCGYFDSGYLGYEASEGIDWIWEHRIEDFRKAGV